MGDLVGIVMTVIRSRKDIKKGIDSIKNQTHQNWFCVIIQEAGMDLSAEIQDLIADDYRFMFVPEIKESGYGRACNAGFGLLGEIDYFTRLDSNDEYKPEHLALRVEYIKKKNLDYLYGKMDIIGADYTLDMYDRSRKINLLTDTSQGPTIFMKSAIFKKMGGYKSMYGADGELLARCEAAGVKIEKLTDNLYKTYIFDNRLNLV